MRAFLNDGKTDFSIHHNIASLPFAHCDFPYRNQGTPSKIKITHTLQGLKVETDGSMCFETKEVGFCPACPPPFLRLTRSFLLGPPCPQQ